MRFTIENLAELKEKAENSSRKRHPAIMHPDEYPGPQVLINFILPSSYVRPHKHPNKEIWMPVIGKGYLLYFNESGKLEEKILLSKNETLYEEVPESQYHGFIALNPMSFVNITQGPHNPQDYITRASWAPEEQSEEAITYFESLKRLI